MTLHIALQNEFNLILCFTVWLALCLRTHCYRCLSLHSSCLNPISLITVLTYFPSFFFPLCCCCRLSVGNCSHSLIQCQLDGQCFFSVCLHANCWLSKCVLACRFFCPVVAVPCLIIWILGINKVEPISWFSSSSCFILRLFIEIIELGSCCLFSKVIWNLINTLKSYDSNP